MNIEYFKVENNNLFIKEKNKELRRINLKESRKLEAELSYRNWCRKKADKLVEDTATLDKYL